MSNFPSERNVSQQTRTQARQLRRNPTRAEVVLWHVLRDRRLAHTKWRRQVPIGAYILDFVCLEHGIVVDCGAAQDAENTSDVVRDAWLASQGFAVLRFRPHQVMNERSQLIDTILGECVANASPRGSGPLIRPSATFSLKGRRR